MAFLKTYTSEGADGATIHNGYLDTTSRTVYAVRETRIEKGDMDRYGHRDAVTKFTVSVWVDAVNSLCDLSPTMETHADAMVELERLMLCIK